MSELVFYSLVRGQYDILRLALKAAQLPTEDLLEPGRMFFGFSDDNGPIGYVGLERDGPDRLLRSLVILPSRQGQGHGVALLKQLETWASGRVERLHLLTTTAAAFFAANGYRTADRSTAPATITSSVEFTSLCPASATYMTKTLNA